MLSLSLMVGWLVLSWLFTTTWAYAQRRSDDKATVGAWRHLVLLFLPYGWWLDGWWLDGWSLDVVNKGRLDKDYCHSNEIFFATEGSKKNFFYP